jgi:hypothetical protein
MRALSLAVLAAACSSSPDPCAVSWSGNFVESAAGPGVCPTLTRDTLAFAIHSTTLDATLMIAIDLGAPPVPGTYMSSSDWSAVAARGVGQGVCEYAAGTDTSPGGAFTLTLDSVAGGTLHGTLDVLQWVQPSTGTDCGAGDTETVSITF